MIASGKFRSFGQQLRNLSGLLLYAVAVTASADTNLIEPELEFRACELAGVPTGAECTRLWVPENPREPSGRQIPLNILRVKALTSAPAEPLFVIVGGPGGAAVRSAPQYLPFFRRLQDKRDIVFVDQRGTGESNGLPCTFTELQFGAESAADSNRQALQKCLANLTADLNFYTTPHAVRDLDQVRQAFGYKQINLWGVSYGTRVILHYMRTYNERVRVAILDGAAPVAIQLPRYVAYDGGQALDKLFMRCSAEPACQDAYGDLRAAWLQLLQQLAEAPSALALTHPRSREPVQQTVDASTVSDWVRLALYARELSPVIPQAIHRATEGDFSVLGGIGLLAVEDIADQVSQGMQMAVLCAEDFQFTNSGASAPEVGELDQLLLRGKQQGIFRAVCQQLLETRLEPGLLSNEYFERVKSPVPTLIFSGEFDPVTPPRWGSWVAEGLLNSRHLVVEGAHHGVIMHGCASRLVAEFINSGVLEELDAGCLEAIKPPAFFIDAAGPALRESVGDAGVEDSEAL